MKKIRDGLYLRFCVPFVTLTMGMLFLVIGAFKELQADEVGSFLIVIITIYCILIIMLLSPYLKDLKTLKDKKFCEITGKVVGYKNAKMGDDPVYALYNPIVEALETKERIELRVYGTKLNKVYKFVYLKHSKLAAFEEIENIE